MAVTRGKTRAAKAKGGLVKQAMTLIALASSAFILLPAGRDIVSYETSILPGEAETRPLMTMAHSSSRTGMWGRRAAPSCLFPRRHRRDATQVSGA